MNDGDWVCCDPQCGNINFAWRSSCNRCSKDRAVIPSKKKLGHEIGKAAAEKSRGLFSADDWQCGRCGNVNWARRQQCNMCNAPKFGEVEERTGLGGGYNERENVEYIERDESDGEYDDFGRKKKKYRGSDEVVPKEKTVKEPVAERIPKQRNEEEEEEEEEDDDDADLSKYDLSDWGVESPKKEQNNNNNRSRSRSRSSASSQSSRSSRSRSSSNSRSSQSSRSRSRSSSESEKHQRSKRTRSRSRSSSSEPNSKSKRDRSRSPIQLSSSRSRDRSHSDSPVSRKR